MQVATGWHLPFWIWHSSMSTIYPKRDSVRKTAPEETSQESPLMGAQEQSATDVYNEGMMLTRTVLPITSEATETEAEMASYCVDTMGKLAALLLLCLTLIHI